MVDAHGREINYARISVTDLCNLKCKYCIPTDGVKKLDHSQILPLEGLLEIATVLNSLGVSKIRVTGGEPLVRRGVMTLVNGLGKLPLKKLAITTNGIYLKEYANKLKSANVDAINISLDTLNPDTYNKLTRGGQLKKALDGFFTALELFDNIKLNTVLMKGINDNEIITLMDFAKRYGVQIRFIELMPFANQKDFFEKHYLAFDEWKKQFSDLKLIRKENIASYYQWGQYQFGMIAPVSEKFCMSCNRIRITAQGELLNCLHSDQRVSLAPYVGDRDKLAQVILSTISQKPLEHHITEGGITCNQMGKIGG